METHTHAHLHKHPYIHINTGARSHGVNAVDTIYSQRLGRRDGVEVMSAKVESCAVKRPHISPQPLSLPENSHMCIMKGSTCGYLPCRRCRQLVLVSQRSNSDPKEGDYNPVTVVSCTKKPSCSFPS